jgi:hypothetical protein
MANIKGRGVRVEIGTTEGAAKVVSAVTQASPGVATSTAHGLNNGSVGYFDGVVGMANLDGQAVRLANKADNTFELERIDTSDFPAFTSGNFIPITGWTTIAKATSYSIGGGEAEALDATVLLDDIAQEENGLLAAQSISFSELSQEELDAAGQAIEAAAISQAYLVFRITLKGGGQRVARCQPSLAGEDVQKGQLGTGSFSAKVKGRVLKLAALA